MDLALENTRFEIGDPIGSSVAEFREVLTQAHGHSPRTRELLAAHCSIGADSLESVARHLRKRLREYVRADEDQIGHLIGPAGTAGYRTPLIRDFAENAFIVSTVPNFARSLIHAAAVLGSDRVAELIELWADGAPREYKVLAVLDGIHIDRPIGLDQGLRVCRLPTSSECLPVAIPNMRSIDAVKILGRTLMEIDVETWPVFFTPRTPKSPSVLTRTILDQGSLETWILALSLVCGQRVEIAWLWFDHGEQGAFGSGRTTEWASPLIDMTILATAWTHSGDDEGIAELNSFAPPAPNLSEESFRRAWTLCSELHRRYHSDQRFKIAVTRWAKAATPGVMNPDRVIDLRIALEALYLDSSDGELGFRLSVTGARHLRDTLIDRKDARRALADFYNFASRIIHGAPIGEDMDVPLVDIATNLCREGILKIVGEQCQPNWADVLLS